MTMRDWGRGWEEERCGEEKSRGRRQRHTHRDRARKREKGREKWGGGWKAASTAATEGGVREW